MALPCVNDGCGTVSSVDGSGALTIDINSPASCGNLLVCSPGLATVRLPEHKLLGIGSDNDLGTTGSQRIPFPSPVGPATQVTIDRCVVLTNQDNCEKLLIFDITWNFAYAVQSPGSDLNNRTFSQDMSYDIIIAGSSIIQGGEFTDTLVGVGPDGGTDKRFKTVSRAAVYTLPPSSAGPVQVTMRARRGTLNTDTPVTGPPPSVLGATIVSGDQQGLLMGFRVSALESTGVTGALDRIVPGSPTLIACL